MGIKSMTYLRIEVTDDELRQIQHLAREQGFQTPEDYIKSLVLEPTKAELLNDIREGLLMSKGGDSMLNADDLWLELEQNDDETAG